MNGIRLVCVVSLIGGTVCWFVSANGANSTSGALQEATDLSRCSTEAASPVTEIVAGCRIPIKRVALVEAPDVTDSSEGADLVRESLQNAPAFPIPVAIDNKYRAHLLDGAEAAFLSPTARPHEAYQLLLQAECALQDRQGGVALPPEGSVERRRRNDLEVGFCGRTYVFPKAESPLLSRLAEVAFSSEGNRPLVKVEGALALTDADKTLILNRTKLARQYLEAFPNQ